MKNIQKYFLLVSLMIGATSIEAFAGEPRLNDITANAGSEIVVRCRYPNGREAHWPIRSNRADQRGNSLAQLLQILPDGGYCWVYANSETEVIKSGIVVDAKNLNLVMHNVTIKTPEKAFTYAIKFNGENSTISGVKVVGPNHREIPGGSVSGTSGIVLAGANSELIGCEVSNMPNEPVGPSNNQCFLISGANSKVTYCKARNPGAVCFKNNSTNAVYDGIQAVIDSPTKNGHNRFFTSTRGRLLIKNSVFRAAYANGTPHERSEAVMVFDRTESVTMRDCSIDCGDNVGENGNHIIKLSTLVKKANFTRVSITSKKDEFNGYALSLASGYPEMNCSINQCIFDHGIVASPLSANRLTINDSRIGKLTNRSHYLFHRIGNVTQLEINRSNLLNSCSMFKFGDHTRAGSMLTLNNVDFRSATPRDLCYVFQDYSNFEESTLIENNFSYGKGDNAGKFSLTDGR